MQAEVTVRFFALVAVAGPDECWLWRGGVQKSKTRGRGGYGWFWLGKAQHAHRVSWLLHHGPIPEGKCVLHRCDVRRCVNPAHLWLGTKADNNRDRDAKGRGGHR